MKLRATLAPDGCSAFPLDKSTHNGTIPVWKWETGTQHRKKSIAKIPRGRIMKNKHLGSDFDDFLQDEGLLAEAEATAIKRVLAFQILKEMEERQLTKSALAKLMNTSRSSLDRLLDPDNPSVTLVTMESAAIALGKKLKIQLA